MRKSALAAVLLCSAQLSCIFGQLKNETEQLRGQWVLIGQVDYHPAEPAGDLVAVSFEHSKQGARALATRIVPWTLMEFVFMLEAGERDYRAAVFHDLNRNRIIDDGETVLMAGQGNRLRFSDVTTWMFAKIDAADAPGLPAGYPRDFSRFPEETLQPGYVAMGARADLANPRFSEDASRQGFWEPHAFLKQHGIGVYMLGPYDPQKIPLLLVSGATGNVHNWDYFLERLDRTRYQPWYFLYPSGMRVFRNGQVLDHLFTATAKTFQVERAVVLAHSMGGLVAREFIRNHLKAENQAGITDFFTFATPWAGHSTAGDGVNLLSTPISRPIPSWLDISAGSRFLQGVFAVPIGDRVRFHLQFAFMPGTGGDGVVELDSQLLAEAQDEATSIRGFHVGHLDILFRDEVFEYVIARLPAPNTAASPVPEALPEAVPGEQE